MNMKAKRKWALTVLLCMVLVVNGSTTYAGQATGSFAGKATQSVSVRSVSLRPASFQSASFQSVSIRSVSGNDDPITGNPEDEGEPSAPNPTTSPAPTTSPDPSASPDRSPSPDETASPLVSMSPDSSGDPSGEPDDAIDQGGSLTPAVTPLPDEGSGEPTDGLAEAGMLARSAAPLGDGSKEHPFLIADAQAFKAIRNNLTASYKLVADINFNGEVLKPIGTNVLPFKGSLDGGGFTLRNFKVTRDQSSNNVGLFGYTRGAVFKGLGIESAEITSASYSYIGILVGYADETVMQDISFKSVRIINNVTDMGQYAGILAGYMKTCTAENISIRDTTVISNEYTGSLTGYFWGGSVKGCHVSGSVTVTGRNRTGGLIGDLYNAGISNSSVTGTGLVTGRDNTGGLLGTVQDGDVTRCFTSISVTGENSTGGLVGSVSGLTTRIIKVSECYALGSVFGRTSVGGLCGSASNAEIKNTYAGGSVGKLSSENIFAGLVGRATRISSISSYAFGAVAQGGGGLAGVGNWLTVTNSYFDSNTTGKTTPTAEARTTAQMLTKENYAGWDWDKTWQYNAGTYPTLKNVLDKDVLLPFIIVGTGQSYTTVTIDWPDVKNAVSYEVSVNGEVKEFFTS
ncbi:MAG: hypothetical protein LBV33_03120, partial [Lachnospiraceae bacterium]|nr:hypothetical protein [Lachnospiraceae bacterium]